LGTKRQIRSTRSSVILDILVGKISLRFRNNLLHYGNDATQ
jgi:hypothetical protein